MKIVDCSLVIPGADAISVRGIYGGTDVTLVVGGYFSDGDVHWGAFLAWYSPDRPRRACILRAACYRLKMACGIGHRAVKLQLRRACQNHTDSRRSLAGSLIDNRARNPYRLCGQPETGRQEQRSAGESHISVLFQNRLPLSISAFPPRPSPNRAASPDRTPRRP
jgi:hypothetical protein